MANNGPHSNGSQFFISMRKLSSLDGKAVAFGQVKSGFEVLSKINSMETSVQRPKESIKIVNCGEVLKDSASLPISKAVTSDTPTSKATFMVIGLDNAGKSTIVNHYLGKPGEVTIPTMGLERENCVHGDFNLSLYGMGGAAQIRGYWENYYPDVHGVIFVLDGSDAARIEEVKVQIQGVLSHDQVKGKPILVYCNKQDLENPLSAAETALKLGIDADDDNIRILTVTALVSEGVQPDPGVLRGLTWLCSSVTKNYEALNLRIKADVKAQKEADKKKREERRKVIEAKKAQREADKAAKEAKEAGEEEKVEEKKVEESEPATDKADPEGEAEVEPTTEEAAPTTEEAAQEQLESEAQPSAGETTVPDAEDGGDATAIADSTTEESTAVPEAGGEEGATTTTEEAPETS